MMRDARPAAPGGAAGRVDVSPPPSSPLFPCLDRVNARDTSGWGESVSREIQRYASIDDILGPSEGRFFSAGYKRIGHDVRNVWFGRRPELGATYAERAARGARISATASLSYPGNW